MSKKDPLIIYWAPFFEDDSTLTTLDWNMLYPDPKVVFLDLIKEKEPRSGKTSMFSCPAVKERLSSTFVFTCPIRTSFSWDFEDLDNFSVVSHEGVAVRTYKQPPMRGTGNVQVALQWVFFSEESVMARVNPPSAHRPTDFSVKSCFPTGKMNIGKWIRPVTSEVQMWDTKGTVTIQEGDPIFYLEVDTDRPILLKRFRVNKELFRHIKACTEAPNYLGANLPLIERYMSFTSTKTDKLVLQQIKKNLVED